MMSAPDYWQEQCVKARQDLLNKAVAANALKDALDEAELDLAALRAQNEALRTNVTALLRCVHQPNPTDASRIDVAPGQHRSFGDAVRALHRDLGATDSSTGFYPVDEGSIPSGSALAERLPVERERAIDDLGISITAELVADVDRVEREREQSSAAVRCSECNAVLPGHRLDCQSGWKQPASATPSGDAADARRYRWLREHSKFANDSMYELWFDAAINSDDSRELNAAIDAAMKANDDDN